jgi:hypothetical protein
MERRTYALALYTGQRLTELVEMARAHGKNSTSRVTQSKTGEEQDGCRAMQSATPSTHRGVGRGVIGHMTAHNDAGQGLRSRLVRGMVRHCDRQAQGALLSACVGRKRKLGTVRPVAILPIAPTIPCAKELKKQRASVIDPPVARTDATYEGNSFS